MVVPLVSQPQVSPHDTSKTEAPPASSFVQVLLPPPVKESAKELSLVPEPQVSASVSSKTAAPAPPMAAGTPLPPPSENATGGLQPAVNMPAEETARKPSMAEVVITHESDEKLPATAPVALPAGENVTTQDAPSGTAVVEVGEEAKEPLSEAELAQLQARLEQQIETLCGGKDRDVGVIVDSPTRLLVSIKTNNLGEVGQLADKILNLPELGPFQVSLEVQVVPTARD